MNNTTYPTRELQIIIKPLMVAKLKRIAEQEGTNPIALVLLHIARLINEWEENENQR
ncbi:hypothetical protein MYX76_12285 [Desulfobacterota bacterium AH_259_B03_O07]|nr:hypothetical protein [Desulfobacterota bacterium AH_259_B03_O07]